MKSDLLLFLVWILFLLGSQLLRKKKRPLKKPPNRSGNRIRDLSSVRRLRLLPKKSRPSSLR